MLSYQHIYHAGNPADVHKHAALAWVLDYMTRKPKPLSYIETHAGRGLYDLRDPAAIKTGEAAGGVARLAAAFDAGHPYSRMLARVRAEHGDTAYPGSPLVAQSILRAGDSLHLAELHPQEHAALAVNARAANTRVHRAEGIALAQSLTPPDPRRGLMLIDPSYEVKSDYDQLPGQIAKLHAKWPVGVIMLWYPILTTGAERGMVAALRKTLPEASFHDVRFPPVREGHRMTGSGLCLLNAPYGFDTAAAEIAAVFAQRG